MPGKAFISYASIDAAYVDVVANRLSRSRILFDKWSFPAGAKISDAIRKAMNAQAVLFVLIATRNSLASTWVKMEIDDAKSRTELDQMSPLVVIADQQVTHRDLPAWMQEFIAVQMPRPTQAARVITTRLFELLGPGFSPLFVGREPDLEALGRTLIGTAAQAPPRTIIAVGLDGIGRRTLLQHALRNNLSLDTVPIVILAESDSSENLFLQLKTEAGEATSADDVKTALESFRAADARGRGTELARLIRETSAGNFACLVVDKGALMDDEGVYQPEVRETISAIAGYPDTYLALVQRRRPMLESNAEEQTIIARVRSLDFEATQRLLTQLLRRQEVPATDAQVNELVAYLDGYPPAIILAVNYAREYGLANLLADKSILVQFKVHIFKGILDRLRLTQREWEVLKILASEIVVTHEVLTELLGISAAELAPLLRRLTDLSLVVQAQGLYEISPPIRDAVFQTVGGLTANDYAAIAKKLRDAFWRPEGPIPSLNVIDVMIHAAGRGAPHLLGEFGTFVFPSALFKIAQDAYRAGDWRAAADFSSRVLQLDHNHVRARTVFFKALVQLEDWDRARAVLAEIDASGRRNRFYLRGFMERKLRNLKAAIEQYKRSIQIGYDDLSVRRDLAHCYYLIGRVAEAKAEITPILDLQPGNPFVLDLAIKIALDEGDLDTAEQLLARLELVDRPQDFRHRRSYLYAARGQWGKALEDADIACTRRPPRFEAYANRINILIEMGRYEQAEAAINGITRDRTFRSNKVRQDILVGLRVKMLLRQSRWRDATEQWERLHQTDLAIHKALRVEILRQKIRDSDVPAAEKADALAELARLGEPMTGKLFAEDGDEEDLESP